MKIKKRTRKEDNITSAPSLSSTTPDPSASLQSDTPPYSTPEPSASLQSNIPVSEPPKRRKITQTEKTKKKKSKYKLKKRQLNKNNPHNNKSTRKNKYFLTATRRWLWKHKNLSTSQLNIRNLYLQPTTFQRTSNRTTLCFTI